MSVISRLKVWIGSDTSNLEKGLKRGKKEVSSFSSGMKKLGGMIAGAFALSSVVSFAKECLSLNKVQAAAEKKLAAVIKATGGAAGLTADEMKKYASQLQTVTTYGDEVTIDAMAIMSTFKSIKGDVFKEAIASAQDMATVLNTDLNSAVMQIGKALETPEIGLTALRRSGVSFSKEQIKQIKQLVAEGKKQEAQLTMLKELQAEFGGAARAAASDAYGAATQLTNAWRDLKEVIGEAVTPSVESIKSITQATEVNTALIKDKTIPTWKKWLGMIYPWFSSGVKAQAIWNQGMEEANEASIKRLELQYKDINSLLGLQNVYRQLNKEQNNYFKQTYDAITAELAKRADGVAALNKEEEARKKVEAEKLAEAEKAKQALQAVIDMQENSTKSIQDKIKAINTLKAATDITDQASLDYFNQEIVRLNELIRKTEELSQKRILDAQKKKDGGVVSKPATLYGVDDAAFELNTEGLTVYDDLAQLPDKLKPLQKSLNGVKDDFIDLSDIANSALENMVAGFGENLGQLIAGGGSMQGFAQLVAGTFADMAINIGKTAIATGTAVLGIKLALKSLNPYVAIAAGAALVALGAAVKSSLSNMADGGGGGGTFSGNVMSGSGTTDIRTNTDIADSAKPVAVVVNGEFKVKGNNLVAVLNNENNRKNITT